MSIERRRWTCPDCGQGYLVRWDDPRTPICPKCRMIEVAKSPFGEELGDDGLPKIRTAPQRKSASRPRSSTPSGKPWHSPVWLGIAVFTVIVLPAFLAGLEEFFPNSAIGEFAGLCRAAVAAPLFIGGFVFGIAIGLAIYAAPTIVAIYRDHPNKISIIIVNIFVGWTLVGWVVAAAWAFTAFDRGKPAG